jgi:hypothetical protein
MKVLPTFKLCAWTCTIRALLVGKLGKVKIKYFWRSLYPIPSEGNLCLCCLQLDPVQQQVLRIGVYELVELGAPDHVINEHVDLVKRLVYAGAAGLTNGDPTVSLVQCTRAITVPA